MGCVRSSVRSPEEQQEQEALSDIRHVISGPEPHGYLPISPAFQQVMLAASASRYQIQTNNQPNMPGASVMEHYDQYFTDPRLRAMATFDFVGQKASLNRKLDKNSVVKDVANLTNEDLERINDFLNYLDREELRFKRPATEVNDIKDAVGKAADSFGKYIGEKYPILSISRKHSVGSIAEGTRLKEPDEFDFILVLNHFNEENVSVERCIKDCVLISDVKPHAHIKIKNLEWWDAKATEPDSWQKNGRVCNWMNFVDKHSFKWAECELNIEIETPSGKLSNSETDLEFTSRGPAFTFKLQWIPTQGVPLEISIDASLALERKGVTDVIELEEVACKEFIPDLLKENTYFILYGDGNDGFKYTFTTTEVKLIQKLSAPHRQCYRILKFLFKVENCGGFVPTYILKTLLLRHASSCTGNVFLFRCLCDVLDKIEDLYKQRKAGVSTVFLQDVKKNIIDIFPQVKLSRFVLFIENELMKIGKSQQSDNSLCFQQLQLKMMMNI